MDDNNKKGDLYNKQPVDTYTREEQEAKKTNTNVIIAVVVGLVVIIAAIVLFTQSGKSHYDRGADFLRQKQYSEATSEFQKVDSGDKDFSRAQSKLNYINGLMAFNNGFMPEANVYLSKVTPDDEYYHDAQQMLQKITDANKQGNLQTMIDSLKHTRKDTVIVKHEIIDNTKKEKDPPPVGTDAEINRKYTSGTERLISKFESLYESAKSAPVESKKDFVNNMSAVSSEYSSLSYNASVKDANILELKRLVNGWMNVRVQFINKLIAENSVSETNNSRAAKEEGDKAYNMTMKQLQKVKGAIAM